MKTESKRMTLGAFIVNAGLAAVFFPALTLFVAGNWRWLEGWFFGLWFDAMVLSTLIYMYRNDPELLAERSKAPGADNQKKWDQVLLYAFYGIAIAWLILMPLDAERFGWSPPFPAWLKLAGGLLLLPALYLLYRATVENTFLSTRVRVQSERKQQVISSGVYGFVRHPLYLGAVLLQLGAPLLLGSLYGLVLSAVGCLTLVVRIVGEEKLLVDELEGYPEYRHKVRYRLIPFVW